MAKEIVLTVFLVFTAIAGLYINSKTTPAEFTKDECNYVSSAEYQNNEVEIRVCPGGNFKIYDKK